MVTDNVLKTCRLKILKIIVKISNVSHYEKKFSNFRLNEIIWLL